MTLISTGSAISIAHRREANFCVQRARLALLLLISLFLLLPAASRAETKGNIANFYLNENMRSPFAVVAESVMPAVAAITAHKTFSHGETEEENPMEDMFRQFFPKDREFFNREFDMPGAGSGFVVSDDGYVLTNNHVIDGATSIEVRLPGFDRAFPAELVGQDPSTDLAVLKIEPEGKELPFLHFGDSDAVQVGDWAIAIGNPLGQLAGSLTVGVISAKGRSDLNIQGGTPRYQDFLQTDAAINFGNSGGPLMDIHGLVIGINTAINASGQNIGFTIPINLAQRIYEQLRDHGRVIRGFLGVQMQTLNAELAEGQDLSIDKGVLVTTVIEGKPAASAGIEVGDVIFEFNGFAINEDRDLQFKVAEAPVGEKAEVKVYRDGREKSFYVELVEYDESPLLAAADSDPNTAQGESWLGIHVGSLSDTSDSRVEQWKETLDIREDAGVIVLNVDAGSPADRARLRAGDLIVEIINETIESLEDFAAAAQRYQDRSKPIALLIRRGELTSYITLDPSSMNK